MPRRLPWWLLVGWAAAVAVAIPLALWGLQFGVLYLRDRTEYVSATNASVSGEPVAVASVNAGRVAAIRAATGAMTRQGDPLADIELAAPVRTTSSGTPVLAFLGSADQQVAVVSPVDGVVASVLVAEGSAVTAGQTIMRVVDPAKMRVTAYVTETDMARIRVGQDVEVYVTALDRTLRGVVQTVVPATTSVFAPTPASGAETKVAAVYPVYVRVDLRDYPQLLGSSAEVRIHTR